MSTWISFTFTLVITFVLHARASADTASCPSTSDEWQKWRDRLVANLSTPADLRSHSIKLLRECQSLPSQRKFFENPEFLQCMKGIQNLSATFSENEGEEAHAFGELPEVFREQEFFELISNPKTSVSQLETFLGQIKKRYPESKTLRMRSAIIEGLTYVSFLPGKTESRWTHVVHDQHEIEPTVLLITVQHHRKDGTPIRTPKVWFKSFSPPSEKETILMKDGTILHRKVELQASDKKLEDNGLSQRFCLSCHRTGAMPLVPLPGTEVKVFGEKTEGKKIIEDLRREIIQTANAEPAPQALKGHGPLMGPKDSPVRTEKFMKTCTAPFRLTRKQIDKVKASMNCASCHDTTFAGPLSYPLGPDDTAGTLPKSTLHWMIESGHMPPHPAGSQLNTQERQALYRCLITEYYGGFKDPKYFGAKQPGLLMRSLTTYSCPKDLPEIQAISPLGITPKGDSIKNVDDLSVHPGKSQSGEIKSE